MPKLAPQLYGDSKLAAPFVYESQGILREHAYKPMNPDQRLFQQQWWQEAAAASDLERAEVRWDGKLVASLSFTRHRVFGLRLLKLPPYTRTLSPFLSLPDTKPSTHSRNLRRAITSLVEILPKHDRFQFSLDPEDPLAFPFWLAGCSIEQGYTFRLPAGTDLNAHWDSLDQKIRNLIRTSAKKLAIDVTNNVESYIDLSLQEHGHAKNKHNFAALRRIARASAERGQSAVLEAKDQSGTIVGVSVLVWDDNALFYWQSSRNPGASATGANSLLIWRAIQMAMDRGLTFDLDGHYSEAGAIFAAKFGFETVVRPNVIHSNILGSLAQNVAQLMGRERSA